MFVFVHDGQESRAFAAERSSHRKIIKGTIAGILAGTDQDYAQTEGFSGHLPRDLG